MGGTAGPGAWPGGGGGTPTGLPPVPSAPGGPGGASPAFCCWPRFHWLPKIATRTSTVAMASTHQLPQTIFSVRTSGPDPPLQSPMTHNSTEARKAAPNNDTRTTVIAKLAADDLNHAGGVTPSDQTRLSAVGHSLG